MNATDEDGVTPLHLSAQNGDMEMTKFLVESGAVINRVASNGWTPVASARECDYEDIGKYLIEMALRQAIALIMKYKQHFLKASASAGQF